MCASASLMETQIIAGSDGNAHRARKYVSVVNHAKAKC